MFSGWQSQANTKIHNLLVLPSNNCCPLTFSVISHDLYRLCLTGNCIHYLVIPVISRSHQLACKKIVPNLCGTCICNAIPNKAPVTASEFNPFNPCWDGESDGNVNCASITWMLHAIQRLVHWNLNLWGSLMLGILCIKCWRRYRWWTTAPKLFLCQVELKSFSQK